MPLYRLLIEGRDFPGFLFDKTDTPFGFFTTRWVEAADPVEAELTAFRSVRWEFKDILPEQKGSETEPTLHLVDIEEVDDIPEDAPSSGATWFPMGND